MSQVSDPSVEEILESIKKVIARDNRAEAARERIRRDNVTEGGMAQSASSADEARISAASIARGGAKPDFFSHEVLDLSELAAHVLDGEHDDHHSKDTGNSKGTGMNDQDDAPLLPETTTASMRESLTALAMMSAPGATPQIVRSGETSLEGLVRELLRPQLAEWLDRNLPPMVEKMVATEISRIVGRKG
jgi:uncharacterized protein